MRLDSICQYVQEGANAGVSGPHASAAGPEAMQFAAAAMQPHDRDRHVSEVLQEMQSERFHEAMRDVVDMMHVIFYPQYTLRSFAALY